MNLPPIRTVTLGLLTAFLMTAVSAHADDCGTWEPNTSSAQTSIPEGTLGSYQDSKDIYQGFYQGYVRYYRYCWKASNTQIGVAQAALAKAQADNDNLKTQQAKSKALCDEQTQIVYAANSRNYQAAEAFKKENAGLKSDLEQTKKALAVAETAGKNLNLYRNRQNKTILALFRDLAPNCAAKELARAGLAADGTGPNNNALTTVEPTVYSADAAGHMQIELSYLLNGVWKLMSCPL